jgi:peptidylprolyl isomerase
MNRHFKNIFALIGLFFLVSCKAPGGNEKTTIIIKTTMGDIKILLYDGTPIHRDNFIKLIKSGIYDGVSFHRVIKDFMIQAGDPATRPDYKNLPDSLSSFTIPAEFRTEYYHKRGALAAAREGNDVNPEMRSSGTQFYIVQGTKYSDSELLLAQQRINGNIKQAVYTKFIRQTADSIKTSGKPITNSEIQEIASMKMFKYLSDYKDYNLSPEQVNTYKNQGGVPRLDQTYTVFGEVVEGMDVVDRIASVATDVSDKPLTDVRILKVKISGK